MLRVEVVNRLRGDGGEALLTKKGMQVRSPKRTTRGEACVLPRTNNVSELAEPGVFPSLFKHSLFVRTSWHGHGYLSYGLCPSEPCYGRIRS